MTRRFVLFATLICVVAFYFAPRYEAQAYVDPVTIAILAPIALKVAQIVAPHIIRAGAAMGKELLLGGADMFGILYLPLGVVESTVLMPWCFSNGIRHIGKGVVAPFKFAGHILLLPFAPFRY